MNQIYRTHQDNSPVVASPAAQLAANFKQGWFPPPVQVPFRLQGDETCVGVVDADVEYWLDGDGSYTHKSVAFSSGLGGLVLGGTMSAIGNARRRNKAAREAAPRWRYSDSARIYMTTARIALQGSRDWNDLWFGNVRTLNYDDAGVIVQLSGSPAARLRLWPQDYWFVMLRKLAFDDIYDVTTGQSF